MVYSIWLIPSEPVFGQLQKVINTFAKEYNGPIFEPHLTLLGNIDKDLSEVEEKAKKLVVGSNSLELSLGDVSFSATYFQSVFVRVKSTAKLMQLNLDAKKIFELDNNVYMPHISLLYGEHSMSIREEAALKVNLLQTPFTVKEFAVVPTSEDLAKWKPSTVIPFK